MTGTIVVGDEVIDLDGLGLRDKSWGPRYWQAISWYRWLPMTFSEDFAMMISIVGGRPGGMVLVGDEYHLIRDCTIESDWDDDRYQTSMRCTVSTDHATYEVTGRVLSLIPLRNRRTDPDGNELDDPDHRGDDPLRVRWAGRHRDERVPRPDRGRRTGRPRRAAGPRSG